MCFLMLALNTKVRSIIKNNKIGTKTKNKKIDGTVINNMQYDFDYSHDTVLYDPYLNLMFEFCFLSLRSKTYI